LFAFHRIHDEDDNSRTVVSVKSGKIFQIVKVIFFNQHSKKN